MAKFKYKNENGDWIEVANKADIPTQPSDIGAQPEGDYITDPNYIHTDNNFTTLLKNAYDSAVNWITTNGANILNHISDSVKHVTAQNKIDWDSKQPAGDYATNTALATKVDKVTGKSLIADTEITKLGAYPNIPATSEGKILSDNGTFIPISAGATDTAANLYASNVNSATNGYKELSYQVDVSQVTKTITTTAQNVIAYGEKYLFASQYGEALINSGQWQLHATGFVDSATGVSRMVLRIFKYSIGGVETELFVKQGEEINNTTAATMLVDYESPNITILATDRIGFQIGFVTTSVVARTLSFYVGDGDAMHINAPFSARHSRLRAKNEEAAFQHITTEQVALVNSITAPILTPLADVATVGALPSTGNNYGDGRKVLSDGFIYTWNGVVWKSSGFSEFTNDLARKLDYTFNTLATKQIKLHGDWKAGDVIYFSVKNLAVITTGMFNAQLWDWINSISYHATGVDGIFKVILSANTTVLGLHLNLTGTVTSASCVMSLFDSIDAKNITDIATNTTYIETNTFEILLAKLNNGLKLSQNTAQKIIKVGTIQSGSYLRLEVENINIITTGAYNFQIYQLNNDSVLGILYNNGIVDVSVLETGEVWIVANITGTIMVAEYDIKMTSSLSAIADRNSKSVVKFQDKEDFGFNYETTGYIAFPTLALFSYENANANKEGILQKITLNVAVSGTFTFAIGSLDQRNWAIISKEFNVFTNTTGKQTFDVSDKFLTIGLNDYLFVYTKKNGAETINYKDYPNANSNPSFIFGSPTGAIEPNATTYGGGIVFSWDIIPLDSYFASKKALDTVNAEISNVSIIANYAFNSIAKVQDLAGNLYKMVVVNGAISLQSLNFQRVLVVGNSLLTGLAGRGLACTVPSNDFASQLLLGIQAKYAPATMTKISAAGWERDLSTTTETFDTLFADASGVYDLIVIRLGENVNDIPNLQSGIEGMIDYLKADYPLATFLVTSTILDFGNSAKNTALSTAASNKGVGYVAINGSTDNYRIGTSRMYTNGSNVIVPSDYTILTHSNDLGFLMTANSMLNAVGYDQLNKSFALNVTANVTADYPSLGVVGGIVTIKTYGGSAPTIVVNSGAIAVTHYQLSAFVYDNRLINGVADTATYASTFIMPNSDVVITIN